MIVNGRIEGKRKKAVGDKRGRLGWVLFRYNIHHEEIFGGCPSIS